MSVRGDNRLQGSLSNRIAEILDLLEIGQNGITLTQCIDRIDQRVQLGLSGGFPLNVIRQAVAPGIEGTAAALLGEYGAKTA